MIHTHLKVPSHWQHYWTKYPEGYTILEALLNWVNQVNGMTDNLNEMNIKLDEFFEQFEDELRETAEILITEWKNDGTLGEIINEVIFGDLNDKIDKVCDSVNSFGAVGDGTTDDTQAIKEALNSGTKLLKFEPGKTYGIKETIEIPDNITIDFQGATIKNIEGSPINMLYIEDKENIVLKNGVIYGDWEVGHESNSFLVTISSSQNISIENMELTNCISDGLYIGYTYNYTAKDRFVTKNINIENCHIHDVGRNGISLVSGDHVTIKNCLIENVENNFPKSAIDIEPETGSAHFMHMDGIVIEGNTFRECSAGVTIVQTGLVESGQVSLYNNVLDDCVFAIHANNVDQGFGVLVDGMNFINQTGVEAIHIGNNPLSCPLIIKNVINNGTTNTNKDYTFYGFITIVSNYNNVGNITIDGVTIHKTDNNKYPSIINVSNGWDGGEKGTVKYLHVSGLHAPLNYGYLWLKKGLIDKETCNFNDCNVTYKLSNYYQQTLEMYTDVIVPEIDQNPTTFTLQTNIANKICSLTVGKVTSPCKGVNLTINELVEFADNQASKTATLTSDEPFKVEYIVIEGKLYFLTCGDKITYS